jgi:predicted chitinase
MSLDAKTLQKAMPGLSADLAAKYVDLLRQAMLDHGITTEKRSAAFMAQLGHESVSLRYFQEIADGSAYEGRHDLGNTHPGDGRRYKGRGPIQLTGRSNYRTYGGLLKLPLEEKPDLAAEPKVGFQIAALFWQRGGLNDLADKGDFREITRRINGGFNGLDDRTKRWNAIKQLGADVVPELTREQKWREELQHRRAQLQTETEEGTRHFLMRRIDELKTALRKYQDERDGVKKPAGVA